MNQDNHKKTVIDHALEQTAATPVPPEVEARLRARLAGFREKLESQGGTAPHHGRHWVLRTAVGAAAVMMLGFGIWISLSPALTLADVQAAVEKRPWVHVIFDNGAERWGSLRDHKTYFKAADGRLVSGDYKTNISLHYEPSNGIIYKNHLMLLEPDVDPTDAIPFAPTNVLSFAGIGEAIDSPEGKATEQQKQLVWHIERHSEVVDGRRLIRFDGYFRDVLDRRILGRQVWVDPQTSLPVRERQRLQLGLRETPEDEYSDGTYDFPDTGPADIYALGVPIDAPIFDHDAPLQADIEELIKKAAMARFNWPKRYRVIQWPADKESVMHAGEVDIIWCDGSPAAFQGIYAVYKGVKIRTQRYFNFRTGRGDQNQPYLLPLPATAEQVLEWAGGQPSVNLGISDGINNYIRNGPSHPAISNPTPATVQVHPNHGTLPFASSDWPTRYLWPLAGIKPRPQWVDDPSGIGPGTLLLRQDNGNTRQDFHLDPAHDLICIRQIRWEKRAEDWAKTSEYELSGLTQLPEGQWYATKRKLVMYGDPAKNIQGYEVTWNVDVTVLDDDDFPPDIFNGRKMLEEAEAAGAKIETR